MPGSELMGEEEKKEIMDVLDTGILFRYNHESKRKNIWKALDFETEVKNITGAKFAHAVSSGTTAVSCALAASGIGAGDEVIVPPFTFVATIEAVLFCGAIPVFSEVDDTLCLSAAGIRKASTPKTKAVLLVHMCGQMAEMDSILEVIKEKKLILIEDAGQAFGSSYKGKSVGLFGKAGCYSFDFFKIATAGEGGVFVSQDESCYQLATYYSDHGHSHVGDARGMEDHPVIGFNFRISELNAAVGVAQTRKVPYIRGLNRKHKATLTEKLKGVKGIGFAKIPDNSGDSATFLNILFSDADTTAKIVDELNEIGVSINYWYKNMYHFINQWDHIKLLKSAAQLPIHHYEIQTDYTKLELPHSQDVISRLVSIGISCNWTNDDLEKLSNKIKTAVERITCAK